MKICIAMDSFKESMTALEACTAVEKGIKEVDIKIETVKIPMADGGEGTAQSLIDATNGKQLEILVNNPLFEKVKAKFGILGGGKSAVIEMAQASGLMLIEKSKRNPMITSTYGTGELIKEALNQKVENIILGIGGSGTNDGGVGMAVALGVKFLDYKGKEINPCGGELCKIKKIDVSNIDKRIKKTNFIIACDVTNPLTGKNGASNVFGRQKGGTEKNIVDLDNNLKYLAKKIKESLGINIENIEGSGAAGGLGGGCVAFLNGKLKNGVDIVIEFTKLRESIKWCDLVITGEGQIDGQTIYGKTPFGVGKIAQEENKKVIGIAGSLGDGYEKVFTNNIDVVFSITNKLTSLDEALKNGETNLYKTTKEIIKVMRI